MLSPYSFEIKNEYDIKTGGIDKLPPNLMSKKRIMEYIIKIYNTIYP